ncbi:hypothetical protein SDC9_69745 [bioreactor metagenome]|uniref:Uncharacterized protein n=1 Tax=bioreactor metagenome TaxID=1076179 RepID=A0A644Y4P8_9ZZZZ
MKLLATASDGCRHFLQLCGCEDEYDVSRGLLNGLQQCIERTGGEHMHLVDDINLVLAALGRKKHLVLDLADIVDAGVARTVNLDDIYVVALGNFPAVRTDSAGVGCRSFYTVERPCQDTGGGCLANPSWSTEQVGMGNSSQFDRMLDGGYHELLTHKVVKLLGPFPGSSYFICHECSLTNVPCEYTILCRSGVEPLALHVIVQRQPYLFPRQRIRYVFLRLFLSTIVSSGRICELNVQ